MGLSADLSLRDIGALWFLCIDAAAGTRSARYEDARYEDDGRGMNLTSQESNKARYFTGRRITSSHFFTFASVPAGGPPPGLYRDYA